MEVQQIMIRTTAHVFNRRLSMSFTLKFSYTRDVAQFNRDTLREACNNTYDKLISMDTGNIEVESVSSCAVIVINGITFTSKRLVVRYV